MLQSLYEQCTEFALLTDGQPPSATTARDEFDAVPDGKTTQDIYIFGLFKLHSITSKKAYGEPSIILISLALLNF